VAPLKRSRCESVLVGSKGRFAADWGDSCGHNRLDACFPAVKNIWPRWRHAEKFSLEQRSLPVFRVSSDPRQEL